MTLEEEVRNGYTIPTEMKMVWKVQMDLLQKLLDVCEKNGLKIWADGGTLLGTIREHGYIPWDDDIDMAMLREDYDKLVTIAPQQFKHPFFFQCGYTEKMYPIGHAQLRMDGTTGIIPYHVLMKAHQGIFIDIFPYDYIPDDNDEKTKLVKDRDHLFLRMHQVSSFDILHPIRSAFLFPYRFSFHSLFSKYENLFRRYSSDKCSNVSCISFVVDFDHLLRDKHLYDETVFMPFEDISMPVPIGYHQILAKQYGDYLVPRQSGSYHCGFWKLDPYKSYKEYLPELKRYYSRLFRNRKLAKIKKIIHGLFR